jgi:signal peptidase I
MYHPAAFNGWWERNAGWYETRNITKEDFKNFTLKNGLNKGDIVIVWGRGSFKKGDIIIFKSETRYPIIHRIITEQPRATKGDNNPDQLSFERAIQNDALMGKAVARIPLLGWIKLFFFEPLKAPENRGFCT